MKVAYLVAAIDNELIKHRYESSKQMNGVCNYCSKGLQIYKFFYLPYCWQTPHYTSNSLLSVCTL